MNIPLNTKGKVSLKVDQQDTALAHGSGSVRVFATPAMVALMENAAQQSVQGHLPAGYTTVGTEIAVKHFKATPVGQTVEARSELIEVDGKKLRFTLEAYDHQGKIGTGTHTRYIVDETAFMNQLV